MSITPQAFYFHLQKLTAGTEKYLIAYSGGVDSHVLLHLCSQLKNSPTGFDQSFSAVYIDHGLSPHAKKWGRHCQHICFELDIPLTIIEVDASQKKGQSPEASARTARYQAFSQLLDNKECLLTAQHLDDQAETLLLQLLRGSGTKGLSAMPRNKPFAKGFLCRPILDYKKQDILEYARRHRLEWIEDESNLEQRFDRNYLRHTVLPLLEKRWPAMKENFAKSAEVLAESQLLLDKIADSDIHKLFFVNADGITEYDKLLLEPTLKLLGSGLKDGLKD
ncbi:MAG: tRNA lysidine(34) synthetase TilS, partial [Gammaproteobacteria bacterium]|nr:tRNA lysidine(34) synthetase TilS [Gammaproteobacteria bacterium]